MSTSASNDAQETLKRQVEELYPSVFRYARNKCGTEEIARDVTQSTMVIAIEKIGEFTGRGSLVGWLFSIARSQSSRRFRVVNREVDEEQLSEEPVDPNPLADGVLDEQREARAVGRALQQLPEKYREVLWLRDVEGMSAPEVAEVLGEALEAVKSRLHRARAALRNALYRDPLSPRGCDDIEELWSKKHEGDLSEIECEAVMKHLETCEECSRISAHLGELSLRCRRLVKPV